MRVTRDNNDKTNERDECQWQVGNGVFVKDSKTNTIYHGILRVSFFLFMPFLLLFPFPFFVGGTHKLERERTRERERERERERDRETERQGQIETHV